MLLNINSLKTAILLLASILLLIGCTGEDSSSGDTKAEEPGTKIDLTITSIKKQLVPNSGPSMSAMAANSVNGTLMQGQLLAENLDTLTQETFNWSIFLNETTFEVESNKSIVLDPGEYRFSLLVNHGNQQYAGMSVMTIIDGQNTIDMTIRPIIGDTISTVNLVDNLADFRFQYDPSELSVAGISSPNLGIILDGGLEEILAINPATGISDEYLNLSVGYHTIDLKLYDGSLQRGKSPVSNQEFYFHPDFDIELNLVPLHGEANIALTHNGGEATFDFLIPTEVVDEAGGLGNLDVLFSIVSAKNSLQEIDLVLSQDASNDYRASTTISEFQADEATLSLSFTRKSPNTLLGSCNQVVVIDTTPRSMICDLTLRRNAVAGGRLLSTIGINVEDSGMPVAGATVYVDGELFGITSSELGSYGFMKGYLTAGNHIIRAEAGSQYGEINDNFSAFSNYTRTISLDQISGPQPGFSFHPISQITAEDGSNAVFYMWLNAQPSQDVVIDVTTDSPTEGVTSVSSLTFTPSNWNDAQPIVVSGVDDAVYDVDRAFNVVLSVASAGSDYVNLNPLDQTFTNIDRTQIPAWRKLSDTGQTACFDTSGGSIPCPAPGVPLSQDGSYSINPLSFYDTGFNTIIDNNTRLMWEKRWDFLGGTWAEAKDYCDNLVQGGLSDWRLPTLQELHSIVDFNRPAPIVDTTYFQLPLQGYYPYWTSTPSAFSPADNAWQVEFREHIVSTRSYDDYAHARCVRGAPEGVLWPQDFQAIASGIVWHRATNLTWQQDGSFVSGNWEQISAHCEGLTLAGYNDWRLPNIRELMSIADHSKISPAIDTGYFPTTSSHSYWSSTSHPSDRTRAAEVNFRMGNPNLNCLKTSAVICNTHCVRGGL